MTARLIYADVRRGIPLDDESVQCVVTSSRTWQVTHDNR